MTLRGMSFLATIWAHQPFGRYHFSRRELRRGHLIERPTATAAVAFHHSPAIVFRLSPPTAF